MEVNFFDFLIFKQHNHGTCYQSFPEACSENPNHCGSPDTSWHAVEKSLAAYKLDAPCPAGYPCDLAFSEQTEISIELRRGMNSPETITTRFTLADTLVSVLCAMLIVASIMQYKIPV